MHVYCVSLLNGGVWLSRFESRCYSCEVNHRSCFRLTLTPAQLNASPIQPCHRRHDCLDRHAETLVVAQQPLLHYTTHSTPTLISVRAGTVTKICG